MAQLDIVSTKRISKTSHSQKLQVVTYGVQKLPILALFYEFYLLCKRGGELTEKGDHSNNKQ